MKALAVLSLGGMLWTATGCLDGGGQADDMVNASDVADGADAADASDLSETSEAGEATEFDEVVARHCDGHNQLANHVPVRDATGVFTTVSSQGSIDLNNEFFQDLGKNGRRCVSCHVPTVGWTITPNQLKTVFAQTDGGKFEDGLGLSAVFRTVDGSNSPKADVSTLAKRRDAYSMLLNRGVIRIGLPVPANAEFELVAVDDPYHFASAAELSLFRRPLPTTNLKFDSTVMWDGREVVPGATVASELLTQSSDAVVSHAQGQPLTAKQRASIVAFETALASAQIFDRKAGDLHDDGAKGGPDEIFAQPFHIGINDNFGDSQTGAAFSPIIFNLFDRWAHAQGDDHGHGHGYGHGHDDHGHDRHDDEDQAAARRAIARGQAVFNTKAITISGVSGINDEAAFGKPAKLVGTCGTCHDTPNGGSHSVVAPLDIGLVDASRRTKDMPLYTLRNKATGELKQVTDPGRAMIDGKWSHIGRFKGPMLRNLAPRAPYFHNGFAADLDAAVDFYDQRFAIKFTKQEKSDLVAFLRSL
jgi:cytochrome c peroxidase